MLKNEATYADTRQKFTWQIPDHYNIGVDICDKWAEKDPARRALIDIDEKGNDLTYSFSDLQQRSNQLANAFISLGFGVSSDEYAPRIGVLLPQCVETALSHIAIAKSGMIALPLFTLFGEEALRHRLKDSSAACVITNKEGLAKLSLIKESLPALEHIICIDEDAEDALSFTALCDGQSTSFTPVKTRAEDPALLIYTSGTTGNPKGALHAHRVLLGHLPGVEMSHNFLPEADDVFWTPADWAWIGGLLDVMMPSLHHGSPVVACRFAKFDPEAALNLMKTHKVQNAFLPPTALKIMKLVEDGKDYALTLRSVGSGGETLGAELISWGRDVLGTTINEFYGQTECNMIVSNCAVLDDPVPGSMGRQVPGHEVAILDPTTGARLPHDEEGDIAVLAPDPVMFLGYWHNDKATQEKFVTGPEGKWLLTGDRGRQDAQGNLYFIGRDDDVISSAGYRIGPAEIEDCLIAHEAVLMAGVVGKPDEIRGSVVAAYVTLTEGHTPSPALADEIAEFVKSKLAAHEYPRVVRFLDEMPLTTTGKIIRKDLRKLAEEEAANS